MTVTIEDLGPLVGKAIEFLPAIVDSDTYLEVGMRAKVVYVVSIDESDPDDPVFQLRLSLEGHDDRNAAFEMNHSFYDKNGTACLSARQAGVYDKHQDLFVGNNWETVFKLVDETDTVVIMLYKAYKNMNGVDISYVAWLEDFVKTSLASKSMTMEEVYAAFDKMEK